MVDKSKALSRSINSSEIEELENPFYINEQLTEHTSDPYKEARTLKRRRASSVCMVEERKSLRKGLRKYRNSENQGLRRHRKNQNPIPA